MTYKAVEGVPHPDSTIILPREDLPDRAVNVMVTILENGEKAILSEAGDYLKRLADCEERLARGDMQWR